MTRYQVVITDEHGEQHRHHDVKSTATGAVILIFELIGYFPQWKYEWEEVRG